MNRFIPHSWLNALILPTLIALLEGLWLAPWLALLTGLFYPDYPALALPTLLISGNVLLAVFFVRALLTTRLSLTQSRLAMLGGALLSMALFSWWVFGAGRPFLNLGWVNDVWFSFRNWGLYVSAALIPIIVAAYSFGQGVLIASTDELPIHLRRSFYIGLLALALLIFANDQHPVIALSRLTSQVLVYFLLGLGGLALASAEFARRVGQVATGTRLSINRFWLTSVLGSIALVVIAGLTLSVVLNPTLIGQLLGIIPSIVLLIGIVVMQPISAVVGWLLSLPWVQQLLALLLGGFYEQRPLPEVPLPAPPDLPTGDLPPPDLPIGGYLPETLLGILVIIALLVGLWLILQRFTRTTPLITNEQRDSIASRELITQQLRDFLADLLNRRRTPAPYLPVDARSSDPRLIIRRAYQHLLTWASNHGHPRQPYFTPERFSQHLAGHYPNHQLTFHTLTAAYLKARYSATPPTPDEAEAARRAASDLHDR